MSEAGVGVEGCVGGLRLKIPEIFDNLEKCLVWALGEDLMGIAWKRYGIESSKDMLIARRIMAPARVAM